MSFLLWMENSGVKQAPNQDMDWDGIPGKSGTMWALVSLSPSF